MSNILTGTQNITTLIDDDIIYVFRTTVATANQDKRITKQNLLTQIEGLITGEFTTETITTGNNVAIPLGAVATYEAMSVVAIIGYSTERYTVEMEFVYDGSTLKYYLKSGRGSLDGDINIKQGSESAGQAYWDIDNNTAGTVTVKYKITQLYPAI